MSASDGQQASTMDGQSDWVYSVVVGHEPSIVLRDSAGSEVDPHPKFDSGPMVFPVLGTTTSSLPDFGLPLSTTFSTGVATLALRGALLCAPDGGTASTPGASALSGGGVAAAAAPSVPGLPPPIALACEWLEAFGVGADGGCLGVVPVVLDATATEPGQSWKAPANSLQFVSTPLGLAVTRLQFVQEPVDLKVLIREAMEDLEDTGTPPRPVDVVMALL